MKGALQLFLVLTAYCMAPVHTFGQSAATTSDTTVTGSSASPASTYTPKPKGPKPIKHEWSVGLRLNTNGWSAFTDFGKVKPLSAKQADMFQNVRFWQIEVTEKKAPQEEKVTTTDALGNKKRYIYGKINNFYALKMGIGFRKMIVGKPDPGTVSIHWASAIGPSLGITKPYYVVIRTDPAGIRYTDNSDFLNQQAILGSAGFSKGISQLGFIPGGHFKSALHFDFSANRKSVMAIETGFNVEYYSKPVPMMAGQKPVPYFIDLFASFQYGRRK